MKHRNARWQVGNASDRYHNPRRSAKQAAGGQLVDRSNFGEREIDYCLSIARAAGLRGRGQGEGR
jgi:hypothetical protein